MIFLKRAFIISGVFISGLIGAGFASGSEILFYFSRFGKSGLLGVILAVLIFSVIQYMVIVRSKALETYSVDEYFSKIMNKPFAIISSALSYMFMLIIFCAMLSGSGELINSIFGIKKVYGVLLMLVSTHLILKKGYRGFLSAQSFLSVIIIGTILIFGAYMLFFREQNISVFKINAEWCTSAVSYAGYNLLTAIAILCILARDSFKNSTMISSLITFLVLLPILTVLWYIICIYSGMIDLGAMPLLSIAKRQSDLMGYFYSITLFTSILTTAVSNSYTLVTRLSDFLDEKKAHYLVMVSGLFLSGFEFEFIVNKMYRFVGIVSVFVLVFIAKDYLIINTKNRFIKKNTEK